MKIYHCNQIAGESRRFGAVFLSVQTSAKTARFRLEPVGR